MSDAASPSSPSEHVLEDGTRVRIRPLTPDDAPALREAWARLGPDSRRARFFGAVPNLTEPMVRYLTNADGDRHIALAAIVDSPDLKRELGVGVARCFRLDGEPEVAEAAVTVVDDMQGRGVGRLLVEELARAARSVGIHRFRGEVLRDNAKVLGLLSELSVVPKFDGDEVLVFDVDITRASELGDARGSPLRRWMRVVADHLETAVTALKAGAPKGGGEP